MSNQHRELKENDVPGAKLVYSLVEQHSDCQLQRWLACRSLPKTGNRSELIDRVNNCIKCGADKDIAVNIDGGKWYDKKLEDLKKLYTTPTKQLPYKPLNGWETFPSCDIPKHFN
ncbi:hypothetical protein ACJMK2_014148 [Sinanodonta woodiana]|uniref:SAP domain-containing protein n=1 Tax=Sinanodonta woodiana TaxID=1069815 RepID=A0ABD3V2P3_SINWO